MFGQRALSLGLLVALAVPLITTAAAAAPISYLLDSAVGDSLRVTLFADDGVAMPSQTLSVAIPRGSGSMADGESLCGD